MLTLRKQPRRTEERVKPQVVRERLRPNPGTYVLQNGERYNRNTNSLASRDYRMVRDHLFLRLAEISN
jgi:hypothetical protein